MQSILTTESVPPRHRADYWEEMVTQQFVPVRCAPTSRSGFSARIRALDLDAVTLCDVRSHGTDVLRTPRHVSQSDTNFFLLSLQLQGVGRLDQAGRTVFLNPGDMALYDTARTYELRFAAEQRQLVLRIPREELLARCPQVESQVGLGVAAATPAARLVGDLARNLAALDTLPSDRSRRSIASTLIELVLDGLEGRAAPAAGSGRLAEAQRIACLHQDDPSFSVARWASAMSISERYLRLLFDDTGVSPAHHLWQQRLDRAASRLRDATQRSQSITDIALASGFGDSAHFSHAFRARFGTTPRAYRHAG